MTGFFLVIALGVGAMMLVGLHRVWSGPSVFDRLVALALVTANSLVILLLVATVLERVEAVVDIAIAYALLGFTLPIALGKHFESRRPANPRDRERIRRDDNRRSPDRRVPDA